MELAHSLQLRLQPKLVMTPQLQQVIKLLQLPTIELTELVRQELETNPVLEEGQDELPRETPEAPKADSAADETMDNWLALAAEDGPRDGSSREREEELQQMRESRMTSGRTMHGHLLEQVRLTRATEEEIGLVEYLIGNLDDSGYLTVPVAELVAGSGAPAEKLERAIELIQALEPPGVGARDLKECLLLQLKALGEDTGLAERIVAGYLERLQARNGEELGPLAADLGATPEEVGIAIKQIRSCDPKPGGQFTESPPAVYPDARVDKIDDEYVVGLNDSGLPPLRLSKSYRELLANRRQLGEEERRFLQERFRSALMLIRGIEQRRVTMHKVLDHIVKTQREFLEKGPSELKPLTLREVADAIGVHESTVSRVVANKYVSTPRGIYGMKDFFSNRLPVAAGRGMSGTAVRERLRDLVAGEDASSPLSDEQLAEVLKRESISIARRTVTKYREALKIPPAWQRKGRPGANGGK